MYKKLVHYLNETCCFHMSPNVEQQLTALYQGIPNIRILKVLTFWTKIYKVSLFLLIDAIC